MDGLLATPDDVMLDFMLDGRGTPRRPLAGMLGPFLPFTVPVEGKGLEFAVPPVLSDIRELVMDPLRSYTGELKDPETSAANLAGMVTGGGLLVGAPTRAAAAESGQAMLGMGGGKLTRADKDPFYFGRQSPDVVLDQMNIDYQPIGLLGQRMLIKPEDLQGKVVLFGAGDRSGTGLLSGVDDVKFNQPVEMLGGRDYQLATPYAWASGKGVITSLLNRAQEARKEFNTDDIILAHNLMGRESIDFSEMQSSALAEMVRNAPITKAGASDFDTEFRKFFLDKAEKSRKSKKEKDKRMAPIFESLAKEYPGVKSPDLRGFLSTLPAGSMREAFSKIMDQKKYVDQGFPFVSKTRFALTEPGLIEQPTFQVGTSFQPIDVDKGAILNPSIPHASYDTAIAKKDGLLPTQFEGTVSSHKFYRDFEKKLEKEGKTVSKAGKPLSSSAIQPSYRSTIPYQLVDQELVDTLSGLLGY